ncbi:MAG: RNA chaperone Hfq [Acidobacteriota bacterium]
MKPEKDAFTNIQDGYLNRARKERSLLTLFLTSGRRIVGRVRAFDRYVVILEDRGSEVMIFKHAIATISAPRAFGNAIRFDRKADRGAPSAPGDVRRAPEGGLKIPGRPEGEEKT